MLGSSKSWKSNKYQLPQLLVQNLPWSTESYLLSRISNSASRLLTASTSCDVQKAKNLNSLKLLNQHLIKAWPSSITLGLAGLLHLKLLKFSPSELHVGLNRDTPSFCWKALVKKTPKHSLWKGDLTECSNANGELENKEFKTPLQCPWLYLLVANLLRTVLLQALICSKKASHLREWQDVTTQSCSDVCWRISHTALTLSDGEANLSECSYKLGFSYSPHNHLTLTVLALLSVHVCVPCTLAGKVREIFFIFTVIKACRK